MSDEINCPPVCAECGRCHRGECQNESASQPLLNFDQWKALGPDKAAEYLAHRRGYSAERQRKLRAILESEWSAQTVIHP